MKKNIFQAALAALFIGVLAVSCAKEKDNDSAIQKPVMVTISADSYFTQAQAEIKATLSQAIDTPVTVDFAIDDNIAQDYTTPIDPELVSAGTITIPAGQTEGTATVTVNNAALPKGKYETQVVAVSTQGANMSSNNSANIILLQGVSTVSISFDSAFNSEGEADFTVSLDMYSEEDCVVNLAQYELDIPGYTNVPSMAFKFDKEVVIKAGETEASGSVAIDLDALFETGRYAGGLMVKSLSVKTEDKFEISSSEFASASAYNFVAPKKNHSWSLNYQGHVTVEGNTYELFFVDKVGGYFDYFITSADQEEKNSFIYPYLIYEENLYIRQSMAEGETLDEICYSDFEGGAYVAAKKRAKAGDYKLWILGVTEQGVCTGEYAVLNFTVEPEPEPTDAYKAWLGDWILGSTATDEKPIVVTISAKDVNNSYYIDGLEGIDTVSERLSATAFFEPDGTITIYPQTVGTWTHPDYGPAKDVLAGLIQDGGATYYVAAGEDPIAYGVLGANGVASLTPGSFYDSETGTRYAITGLKYYWVVSAGAGRYTTGYTSLPNSLIAVKPEPNTTVNNSKKVTVNLPLPGASVHHGEIAGTLTDHVRIK